jgi:PKD repeat protein
MKNIRQFIRQTLPIGFGLLLLTGCTEPPEACFTPSSILVDVNTDVMFTNCSEPIGEGYIWDFGDGTTDTDANPVHRYPAEGQYLVGLTAKGKTRSGDSVFETLITAGQRLISLTSLTSLPATNPSGDAWDAADNADIAVRFSRGNTMVYQSPTRVDAVWTFPMAVQMPSSDLVLSPEAWTIAVLDIDGVNEEVMTTFSVNFATVVPSGELSLILTGTNSSSLQLTYTLRQ